MPCPARAMACHVNGVVSKDDSLRLFDSSGVDERKKRTCQVRRHVFSKEIGRQTNAML